MKKTYILDTNVILHDFGSLHNFQDNDVVIPIVVIEELDNFKKGNEIINFNARQAMRELDKLSDEHDVFSRGIPLGKDKGKLFIKTVHKFPKEFKRSFSESEYADTKILSIALYLQNENPDEQFILVTQDINLRLKARAFKVKAQDYTTGKIVSTEKIHKEVNSYLNVDTNLINSFYQKGYLELKELGDEYRFSSNEYFILSSKDKRSGSALAYYSADEKKIKIVQKKSAYHIKPRNSEQSFAVNALMRKDIQLVTITGCAGTGKTLLALAAALQQSHNFYQIMLARPIVALSNKDLGYLPGNAVDKISPYMQPLFDNLNVIKQNAGIKSKDSTNIDSMLTEEKLIISPLAYIRGRSLSKTFFIIDEAQNLTPHEIKTIITRAGEGTKIVFTGDIDQIDSPYLDNRSNGLSYLTDKMKGQDIFAHVNLVKGERSKLAEIASKLL